MRDEYDNFVFAKQDWCSPDMNIVEVESWRLPHATAWIVFGVQKVTSEINKIVFAL